MGIQPMPQGTLEELRREGIDPRNVASCHESGPRVRGCPFWNECPFDKPQNGRFKGQGPKYVGYFLQTDEGARKEDFMVCHAFVRTMKGRQDSGAIHRMQGFKNAEIIRIVAQEGEKITTKTWVPINPEDRLNGRYKEKFEPIDVPKYPRPGENPMVTYEQMLAAQELRRQRAEVELGVDAFESARATHIAEAAKSAAPVDLELGAAPVVVNLGPTAAPDKKAKP
jgi:hypothetical protein